MVRTDLMGLMDAYAASFSPFDAVMLRGMSASKMAAPGWRRVRKLVVQSAKRCHTLSTHSRAGAASAGRGEDEAEEKHFPVVTR